MAIGGGPASDPLSVAAFIQSHVANGNFPPIDIDIYDLNYKAWKECTKDALDKIYSGCNIIFNWKFINHMEKCELGNLEAHFITICWTLNEHNHFNEDFWNALVKNNLNSIFIVVEGEIKNIDKLYDIFLRYELNFIYYERYANPRKIIARNN